MSSKSGISANRPIEVIHIERASFSDLHDIGLETLSKTDATIIDQLDMPGYDDLIKYVNQEFSNHPIDSVDSAKRHLISTSTMKLLEAQYCSLIGSDNNGFRLAAHSGESPDAQKTNPITYGSAPHIDLAVHDDTYSITLNATLFAKGEWFWGLSGETAIETVSETRNVAAEYLAPLAVGGAVILGEHARVSASGQPCTVVHEVISPEESWNAKTVQRVRILHYPRSRS